MLCTCCGVRPKAMPLPLAWRQQGITIGRRGLTDEQVREAATLYATGKSLAWLGTRFGASHTTVATALRRNGNDLRSRPGWV